MQKRLNTLFHEKAAKVHDRRSRGRGATNHQVLIQPGFDGRLLNVSSGGVALESSWSLRIGATYRLKCGLFEITAVVRWSRLARTRVGAPGDIEPVFRSGLSVIRRDELRSNRPS